MNYEFRKDQTQANFSIFLVRIVNRTCVFFQRFSLEFEGCVLYMGAYNIQDFMVIDFFSV